MEISVSRLQPLLINLCQCLIDSSYSDHLTKHTGEKPWKCEYCNVSLGRKRDLIKHGISKKHKAAVLAASQSTRNNARHSETENLPQEIQSSLSSKHGAAASRQSRFHRRKNSDLNSVQPPEIQGDTDIGHEHVSAVAPDLGLDYGQSEYGAHAHMQTQMGGYHPLGTPLIGSSSTTKPLAATVQQGLGVSFLSPPYLSIMPMNESLLSGLILPSEDRSYSQSQLGVYGVSLYSTSQLDSFGLNQPLVGLQRPIMPQTSNTTLINPSEVEFSQTVPPSFVVPSNYEYAYDQDDSIFDQFTNLQSPQYPSNSQTNVSDRESSVYGQPPPSNSGSQYPQQEHG